MFSKINILALFLAFNCAVGCARYKLQKLKPREYSKVETAQSLHISSKVGLVHCLTNGSDTLPSICFIHGSPGDCTAYLKYLEDPELTSHFRVIVFDRPGYGESLCKETMHVQEQADVLSEAYKAIANEAPCFWVGHSLGGPIAVLIAARHPDIVSGLAILAGSVCPELEKPERWRSVFRLKAIKRILPSNLRRSNEEIFFFKKDSKLLLPCWSKITCPVLLIHGTADPLVPFENANYAMDHLVISRRTTLIKIMGANHFIPWEHFELVRSALVQFFITSEK